MNHSAKLGIDSSDCYKNVLIMGSPICIKLIVSIMVYVMLIKILSILLRVETC